MTDTTTTTATETMTPAARADEVARINGVEWAAELMGECCFARERAALVASTTMESLSSQDFTALRLDLKSAGLLEQWETRERELCSISCRAVLATLADATED